MIVLCNIAIFTGLHIYVFNDMEYPTMPAILSLDIKTQEGCAAFNAAWVPYEEEMLLSTTKILSSVGAYVMLLLITFLIIEVFLGLFDEAIISTLHCMACDMELNGGRPKYGPPSFHEKMNEVLGNPDLDNGKDRDAEAIAGENSPRNPNDQTNMPMNAPPQGQPMMGQ